MLKGPRTPKMNRSVLILNIKTPSQDSTWGVLACFDSWWPHLLTRN